jgi:endonuclease I
VQDPVNAADRFRNDLVMGAQGNRNPYIDHPEYVAAVGKFLDSALAAKR